MTVPQGSVAASVMANLKDFQRRTVDYAFNRMFHPASPNRRFLVADEVGLGKTMVAKGLIARTIEHLGRSANRVDVVYVCSNADIAAQNVSRLLIQGQPAFAQATRLTLLPLVTKELDKHAVNFISFTPGTTFNQGNRTGRKAERRLIYQMLEKVPGIDARGLLVALRGSARWESWCEEAQVPQDFDENIAQAFRRQVSGDGALMEEIRAVTAACRDRRRIIDAAMEERRLALTGVLRQRLAKTCLAALEPDLVILDEFQRFSDLFDDPQQNPAAELAHQLFNYSDELRILLLSATPYKMYSADDDQEDHYRDFLRTVRFLLPHQEQLVQRLEADIRSFRTGLLAAHAEADLDTLHTIKARIENVLRRVMSRTERVAATHQGDAMVREHLMVPRLEPTDLHEFKALDTLARRVDEPEPVEYWKSCPYLLSFMKDYQLKQAVRADAQRKTPVIADVLASGHLRLLSQSVIERYTELDPANPRMRALVDEITAQGLWRLLWLPPSLPYWQPQGSYAGIGSVTKHLVFSAWNVVPDALAAMLSYEAERRLVQQAGDQSGYNAMPKRFTARLRFSRQRDGRLQGMTAMLLMFPARTLVRLVDPVRLACSPAQPAYATLRQHAAALLAPLVEPLLDRTVADGPFDRRWYWVALARLEALHHADARVWCETHWRSAQWTTEEDEPEVKASASGGWQAHVDEWLRASHGPIAGLGRVPVDLVEVLADVALAAPATCALRALMRCCTPTAMQPWALLDAAAGIAHGLRSQFNSPRAVAMLQGSEDEDSYWQRTLQYAADGNLQALLDEYAHVLFDAKGLAGRDAAEIAQALATAMSDAMLLRAATLHPDEVSAPDGRPRISPLGSGLRTHFALRFGDQDEDKKAVTRKENVQAAFNSPFWPFVLASTSVGQEGLDFHTWCHSVIHWNLPSNPVDMEQREGRVHRYKGHAVRKNVALRYGLSVLTRSGGTPDPWTELFDVAVQDRAEGSSDLVPYWIFEHGGGACIERRIVALPLSRDEVRYRKLRRNLALYRMVFAQPRQDDLMACLEQTVGSDVTVTATQRWRICLAPLPAVAATGMSDDCDNEMGEDASWPA